MRLSGPLSAAVIAAAALALPAPVAVASPPPPAAVTRAATEIDASAATLNGAVTPIAGRPTYYVFAYWTAGDERRTPPASVGPGVEPVPVSARVAGLSPAASYAVRLVAFIRGRFAIGDPVTFTTAAAPPPPLPPRPTPAPPAPAPVTPPVLGKSVNVAVRSGTVSVKPPGASAYVPLTELASIPVGSLIDARHGSVTLRSARPGGGTQTGTFHGGLFEVRLPRRPRGMVELVLRGPMPSCPPARGAVASARPRPPRRLWGRTTSGRFRTRGSGSVTTVRGTIWVVSDRCAGTLTRVKKGSVTVRNLRSHRRVTVRAGQRYLARRR